MKAVDRDEMTGGENRSMADRDIPSVLSVSSAVKNYHFHHREQ